MPPTAVQCLALIRLLEESLTNVIKHSRAQHVRVCLELSDVDQLVLRIEDDSVGFDVAAVRQARMSVGGTLTVSSEPGYTMLMAQLALQPAQPSRAGADAVAVARQAE